MPGRNARVGYSLLQNGLVATALECGFEVIIMGMSDEIFEVMCPDCGAMLKIDPVTRHERCSDDESDSYPRIGYQHFIDSS